MSNFENDILRIGEGAEIVIVAEGRATVLSGGHVYSLRAELSETPCRIELEGNGNSTVVFTGRYDETLRTFRGMLSRLERVGRKNAVSRVKSALFASAAVAVIGLCGIAAFHAVGGGARPMEGADGAGRSLAAVESLDAAGFGDAMAILDRPDFLDAGIPFETPRTKAEGDSHGPAAPDSARGETEGVSGDGPDDVPQTAEPTSAAASPDADADAATGLAEESGAAGEPTAMTAAAAKEEADAAVATLLQRGMTAEEARKLLLDLQRVEAAGGDELTPEMIQSLPEEVAAVLAGRFGDPAQGEADGGTMRILPTEVVDGYRGKDGIASIPENYSWYARTGGTISIPLPGGGDIKKPEDMLDFGFHP